MAVSPPLDPPDPADPAPARPPAPAALEPALEIAREVEGGADLGALARAIVRVTARLVGADQATVGLVEAGEVVTVAALAPWQAAIGSHFPIGFGVAGWVAATGQPAVIADVREDRRYVALPYPEVRSFVGLPLATGGRVVGVLSLSAWRPGAFAPDTSETLAPFAEYAALVLSHARADASQRARLDALEASLRTGFAERLHDLKAPLNAAAGFLELLAGEQAEPLAAQQKEFLDTARAECARLKDGLNALLEVGVASERPLRRSVVRPAELAATALERARGEALSRGVELALEADERTPATLADREAVLQVLANLVQNALRVSPRGTTVTLAVAGADDWACFMVADRGPGVPEEAREAIFERYGQAEGRGERAAGQVGLGLWLAREIVRRHGGRIWAENRAGGGTRFCFALPSAEPNEG